MTPKKQINPSTPADLSVFGLGDLPPQSLGRDWVVISSLVKSSEH